MSAPEQGVWGWVHDEDCRIQTDDHSEACARRSATLMAFIQRHRDAALAAARAESDALRAALEWLWRHAGQSHELRAFAWVASPRELGYLICRRCPAGDEVFQVTPNPDALAPSPAEPAAPEPPYDEADDMCPNCVTPWKCNGPHFIEFTPRYQRQREGQR